MATRIARVRGKVPVAMLCGLPGSGKTVLARKLEVELPGVRFSVDEWMIRLYGRHMPRELLHERLGVLKELLWDAGRGVVKLQRGLVLDFGFWKRQERMLFKRRIEEAGGEPLLYFLDVPLAVLGERLAARNRDLPEGAYEVTPEMLELFAGWFEPPSEDEGFRIARPTLGGPGRLE